MANKRALVKVLRDLADMVDSSSEEDLRSLLEGGVSKLASKKRPSLGPQERRRISTRSNDHLDLGSAVESLRNVPDRESGFEVLERLELTRTELQELARLLDLQVMREDNSHRLREKIVENTVGARLNSQAIRGG